MQLGLNFNTIPIGNNKLPLLSPNCIRAVHEVINRCKYTREKIVTWYDLLLSPHQRSCEGI
jgi:hypothetical protein